MKNLPVYNNSMYTMTEFTLPLPKPDDQTSASCTSWRHMKKRFNDYFILKQKSAEGGTSAVHPASLLMYISGNKIREIMKTFSCKIDQELDIIENVFENIEDVCLPSFILLYERFKFFSLRQTQSEDFQKFLSELQMLGDYCELEEHQNKCITSRIVNGVYSENLRKQLQSIPDLEMGQAVEICSKADHESIDGCLEVAQKRLRNLKVVDQFSHVDKLQCIGNNTGHKSELCENVIRKCGTTSRRSKSKKRNRAVFRRNIKANTTVSVASIPDSSAKTSSLRQTRSRTFTVCNITKILARKRRKSISSLSECEESRSINGRPHSDAETFHQSDNSRCLSNNIVVHQSLGTARNEDTVKLVKSEENIDINQMCHAEEINTSLFITNEEGRRKDILFDDFPNKDVEVRLEVLGEDKKSVADTSKNATTDKVRKCPVCGLTFSTVYLLKRHARIHSGHRLYNCSICDMSFIHCGSRSRHMRQSHPELLKFQCDECNMLFERQKALDLHKLSHSKNQEISCDDCGAVFMSTKEHYQHRRREHRNTRYSCDKCGQHFPYPSKLKLHLMSKHNATKPFMCEICGSSFAEKNMLATHKNIHSGERKHECITCGRRFLLKTTLNNHIQTHIDQRPHTCDVCGMSFKLSYYLKSHMKTHTHNRERPHICSKCGSSFLKLTQLRNHERKHTGEKPYKCEICNTLFSQISSMKKHVKQIHEGLKPKDRFSCEYCGLSFTHSCKLKLHLMKHTGERPFACKICGLTYRENHQLTTHMKIHDGSQPFKCPICGQRFLQKSSLEGHIRKHTGEKPFICPVCGQHFSHKGYLRDHVKVHEENRERKYKCSICDKAFTCSSHMRSHERLHSGEKPHKCDICGSRFTKRSSVKKHMRRTHGIQDTATVQDSVVVSNIEEAQIVTLSQLQPISNEGIQLSQLQPISNEGIQLSQLQPISNEGIHPEMYQCIQQQKYFKSQTCSEMRTGLHGDLPKELQPILHVGIKLQLHSELCPSHIHTDSRPELLSHVQPQIQQGMCTRLQTVHTSGHQQKHHHHGIHIIHPNAQTSTQRQVEVETRITPSLTTNINPQISHQEISQEMHVYTLAS